MQLHNALRVVTLLVQNAIDESFVVLVLTISKGQIEYFVQELFQMTENDKKRKTSVSLMLN